MANRSADQGSTTIARTTEPTSARILLRRLGVVVLLAGVMFGLGAAVGLVEPETVGWPAAGADADADGDGAGEGAGDGVEPDGPTTQIASVPDVNPRSAEPPPSAAHDRFTVGGDRTELDVLANDALYGEVTLTVLEQPVGGAVEVVGDRLSFSADGFVGDAVFSYQICSPTGCDTATAAVASVPDGAARFVVGPPDRVLDTRDGQPPQPSESRSFPIDGEAAAVAVSISVAATVQEGEVIVDAGAGPVVAIRVGGPMAMTTNTVVLAAVGGEVSITSTAGGHLVADVVGRFERSGATASGRFVSTGGVEVGQLITAQEGRTASFDLSPALDGETATAVLAIVTADVGNDGGMVRLGPEQDGFDQMLMWGPPNSDDRLRQGLVLLVPSADAEVAVRYDGGSVLTLDVLGYFTSDSAQPGYDGLLVTTDPTTLFDGTISADSPVTVDNPAGIGRNLFVVERSSGRSVSTVKATDDDGRLQLGAGSGTDRQLSLDLLAVFL